MLKRTFLEHSDDTLSGGAMTRLARVLVLGAVLALGSPLSASLTHSQSAHTSEVAQFDQDDLAESLVGWGTVCLGHIQAVQHPVDYLPMFCHKGNSPMAYLVYVVDVDSVLLGNISGAVFNIHTLFLDNFPGESLDPGTKVLVAAETSCPDESQLWGRLLIVHPDGTLQPDARHASNENDQMRLVGVPLGAPITLPKFLARLREVERSAPSIAFARAAAAATMLVTSVSTSEESLSVTVTPLATISGTSLNPPQILSFSPSRFSKPRTASVGDTLLVPLPRIWSGGTLHLDVGYFNLRVRKGYVRSLSMHLTDAPRLLTPTAHGMSVGLRRMR